jgi:hypothetical protein
MLPSQAIILRFWEGGDRARPGRDRLPRAHRK